MKVDAIAHVPISTLLILHSDCTQVTQKHLFDLRYFLLRGRTFSLMNALVPLSPERCYADRANYPLYSFPGSANDVSVTVNICLITGGSSGADCDRLLVCTIPFARVIPLCSCPLRDDVCPHLGRPNAVLKDMNKSFMMSGAGQMPLACRVPLASQEAQIQLMGIYCVAYPDLVFRECVSPCDPLANKCPLVLGQFCITVPSCR